MSLAEANERIGLIGSEHRAGVLAEELRRTPNKVAARGLLREWFNICDALAPWRDELRAEFERVGFVTDTDEPLELPAVVYRAAWEDDDVDHALSWTLDYEVAERFCKGLVSPRAWFLGIKRDDVDAHIYQGACVEAYGYLTSRNEAEVIARTVEHIRPIATLVTVARRG